jgi:hypothetical protein
MKDITNLWRKAAAMTVFFALLFLLPFVLPNLYYVETPYWSWFVGFACMYHYISIFAQHFILLHYDTLGLSKKAKLSFPTPASFALASNTQFTGLVHALISSLGAIYFTCVDGSYHQDHLFGTSFFTSIHGIHSCALFFTELIDLILNGQVVSIYDKVIIFHHICGLVGFSMAAYSIGTWYSFTILLSEISSIFLGLRWFLLQFDYGSTSIFKLVEYSFVGSFILIRMVGGWFYATPILLKETWTVLWTGKLGLAFSLQATSQVSPEYAATILRTVFVLYSCSHLMNLFFLYQIIQMAIKSGQRSTYQAMNRLPEKSTSKNACKSHLRKVVCVKRAKPPICS